MKKAIFVLALVLVMAAFAIGLNGRNVAAQAAPEGNDLTPPVNQIIVKYKDSSNLDAAAAQTADQMERLSAAAGVSLRYFRPMSGGAHVLRLPERIPLPAAQEIAQNLAALPEVEYAEPDYILLPLDESPNTPQVTPNDPQYGNQWHYFAPGSSHYGVDAPGAWDITTGSSSVYIAVLDTGITDHADLSGRWTGGYDMISDSWVARDGDGRDSDPHDPGDWVTANECGYTHPAQNSSWHGTHVAGTIGAATNNNTGVAGLNWVSQVIPVRVLGRCGGTTSDIADAIRWAAGLSVTGVPANSHPAQVINMSLGGWGSCETTMQSAITAAYNAGTSVVVAAGNNNDDAGNYSPASCNNVVTVAATDRNGDKAYYSNYGSMVEIAAPGGDTRYSGSGVLSTLNTGATVPAGDTYEYYQGTSMATPHVAGIVSLMYSVNSGITPAEVLSTIQNTVTAFPAGSSCSTALCGSGIINAAAAVAAASPGPSAPTLNPISNGDGDGNYTVSWSAVTANRAGYSQARGDHARPAATAYSVYLPLILKQGTVYTLQEDDNSGFTSPTTVYNGSSTSWSATGKAAGTYYYRVRATTSQGTSGWSNTQSVTVGGASWVTITTMDFEGGFPGDWQLLDNSSSDGGAYLWGQRNCQVSGGAYGGWAVGGGADGSALSCGSNYPNDAATWLYYGPFDLTSAQDAEMIFQQWVDTEPSYDSLCRMASVNGSDFYGTCYSGNSSGWVDVNFDLTNVYTLGDLTGESAVWVALLFASDGSVNSYLGAFADNIVVRKCATTNCPATLATAQGNPDANFVETPLMVEFPH